MSAWPGSLRGQARAGDGPRRNVLVLLTDDQTYNTIMMLGNGRMHTPNLDRLAAQGTTMSHCFNQGGWHGAICVASRAMMHCGRHLWRVVEPHNHRDAGLLSVDGPLWAEHFRASGYATFGTGKWHNGGASFARSFSHGDAVFLGGMHPYNKQRGNAGGPITLGHVGPDLRHYDGAAGSFERYDTGEAWSTDLYADAAASFIESRRGADDPFFAYVSFAAPHDPRHAPQQYLAHYSLDEIELPPNFLGEHPFDFGVRRIRDEAYLPYPRDPEVVKLELLRYYAMISHIDDRVGDLIDMLKAIGQLDNTYIVFTSDHGLAMGEHGLLGKQNLYDHSVRVPMVWRGPGIAPGEISRELVYLHQLYPTTCELAGLAMPENLDVPSLVPVIRGEQGSYRSIYGAYTDTIRMLRTDRYKLIRYPKIGESQLFDLEQDPWEMNDLAEQDGAANRVSRLDQALRDWMVSAGDPLELVGL
ncbi:MAG: sulfatase-like hydrolase/transferase [Planctomycetota bacterium]